jgi:hypothetical protein
MSELNVRRHILLLALASAALAANSAASGLGGWVLFAAIGAAHALCVVGSLRHPSSALRAMFFVLSTAIVSAGVPFIGFVVPASLHETLPLLLWAIPSAIGAVTYAALNIGFWFPQARSLVWRAGTICPLATILAVLVTPPALDVLLLTVFWWVAFSVALIMAANNAFQPTAPLRGAAAERGR